MRLVISGAPGQGKKLLMEMFLKNWPMYRSSITYFDINLELNQANQWNHLNDLTNKIKSTPTNANVIFNCCPLDTMVYNFWAWDEGIDGFDKDFIDRCTIKTKDALAHIDIIFYTPITKVAPVQLGAATSKEVQQRRAELDSYYKDLERNLIQHQTCVIMDSENHPPILELVGSPLERIEIMKLYIKPDGDSYDNTSSVFNEESLAEIEKLLRDQKELKNIEDMEKKIKNSVSLFSEDDLKKEQKSHK